MYIELAAPLRYIDSIDGKGARDGSNVQPKEVTHTCSIHRYKKFKRQPFLTEVLQKAP